MEAETCAHKILDVEGACIDCGRNVPDLERKEGRMAVVDTREEIARCTPLAFAINEAVNSYAEKYGLRAWRVIFALRMVRNSAMAQHPNLDPDDARATDEAVDAYYATSALVPATKEEAH